MWQYWSGYMKLWVEKTWTLTQRFDYPPWQCSSSQGAHCKAVCGPKIDYWNETHSPFLLFGSEWLTAVSRNKICLKRTISEFRRHPKRNVMTLKAIPQQKLQKCPYFQQWHAASLG
jgi:hypothetical protein